MTDAAPPSEPWLDAAAAADPARLGGKASALHALRAFDVPAWFVVPPDATIDRTALIARARALGPRLAVRSSAVGEDGAAASFAGQFESLLHVAPEDVPDAVATVRASAHAAHLTTYRAERAGDADAPSAMAVLVQRMIEPTCAGVAFTIDPVTGDECVVISAVRGTADGLVTGTVSGETTRVDLDRAITRDGDDGSSASISPIVSDDHARAIAALARSVSAVRGAAQDIEWAIDDTGLFLLQARPITTVTRGPIEIWDDANIAESYPDVTTPLTFSFARRAYEEVYQTFCAQMGVSARRRFAHASMFRHMLGLHRGRIYYNLLNWYRLIGLLPGAALNAPFMEQMMGLRDSLPGDARRRLDTERDAARTSPLVDAVRIPWALGCLLWRAGTLPWRRRAFERRMDRALAACADHADADAVTLVAMYRALEAELLPHWDAPILNDFFAMITVGVVRALGTRLAGPDGTPLHNDLLKDVGDVISLEPARRIERMAAQLRELAPDHPDLADALRHGDRAAIERGVAAVPPFHAAFESYLTAFGDRCLGELKLESRTLRDDPTPLARSIAALALRTPPDVAAVADARQAEACALDDTLRAQRRAHPAAGLALRLVLPIARRRVRDRENLRFERTRVFGRVRSLFRALGARLAERGVLACADDIVWLTVEEALGCVTGVTTLGDVRGTIAARQATYAAWRDDPLPSRFETRGGTRPLHPIVRPAPPADADGDDDPALRRGVGSCAGVVRGRVRRVIDPVGIELAPDEIVIAERTDPGWVMIFPAAAAIAVEHGSMLSHTSIVARELGLPCVVAVPGLLAWLQDGDVIELDGAAGTIRRLDTPEP